MGRWAPGLVGLALTLTAALAPVGPAEAAKVLLFYSSRYVHITGTEALPPDAQEADNVKAAIAALGHTVTTIAGPNDPVGDCGFNNGFAAPGTRLATAAEYQAALATADLFLIPEHSRYCDLAHDITSDVVAVWRNWVANGGGLVIHTGFEGKTKVPELLAILFGWRLGGIDGTGVTTTRRPAAAATLFAGGPAMLPGNAETGLVPLATLPAGSISVYDDGTNASVVVIPYRAGKVILLGWDWAYSDPPFPGEQNGGWFPNVLNGALQEALAKQVTVALAGDGAGTVTGTPAGIERAIACGTACTAHYPRGTRVTLTPTPVAGGRFAGWSGGGCAGSGSCTVTLEQDVRVTAIFGTAGTAFADVPAGYWARPWIEALVAAGVTAGCGGNPPEFCPESPVTREEMAVFLVRAKNGPGFAPAACTTPPFADVPCASTFAPWIAELVARGVTAGCAAGLYCPGASVTREEMAVFLLKTLNGSAFVPPPCTAAPFGDVPCTSPFAPWIQELVRVGVTGGCAPGRYCPADAVTRAEMAVFLVNAFKLPL